MLLEFGRASWIGKARRQPDKVRMVLEKVRTDGLAATLESVNAKLDQAIPLGYCNAGVVLESGADGFSRRATAWFPSGTCRNGPGPGRTSARASRQRFRTMRRRSRWWAPSR